jgi:hypothetical protein
MFGQQSNFHSESAKQNQRAWLPGSGIEHPACQQGGLDDFNRRIGLWVSELTQTLHQCRHKAH